MGGYSDFSKYTGDIAYSARVDYRVFIMIITLPIAPKIARYFGISIPQSLSKFKQFISKETNFSKKGAIPKSIMKTLQIIAS